MTILYLISDSFPYGKAYASRARAITKSLAKMGHNVIVLCDNHNGECSDNEFVIFDIEAKASPFYRFFKLPFEYRKKVKQIMHSYPIDLIIVRSMFDRFWNILKYLKKTKKPIVLESCERYDKKTFNHAFFNIRYYQYLLCWNHLYNKVDGVIAISRYLESHYKKRGIKTIRVPGILETGLISYDLKKTIEKPIKLIYSGDITGGKEQFEDIIKSLSFYNDLFELHIYGPSKREVLKNMSYKVKKQYSSTIEKLVFEGRVSQTDLYNALKNYHFGIFVRPNRLSSRAGFPTKLGEYLSAGLPVISNNTGDISLIVSNESNGYLISEESICSPLKSIFCKILNLSVPDYNAMQLESLRTCSSLLSFNVYSRELSLFLESFCCKN